LAEELLKPFSEVATMKKLILMCFVAIILTSTFASADIQKTIGSGDVLGGVMMALGRMAGFALIVWGLIALFRKMRSKNSPQQPNPRLTFSFYDDYGAIHTVRASKIPLICGSDINCDLRIEGLLPIHFKVLNNTQGVYVQELSGGVKINSIPGSGFIQHNDVLQTSAMTFRINIQ
jgi:hypothetical protein